jgi:hypothetical protein
VAAPSVLIVTNSHDRRESTDALRRIAAALSEQHHAKVAVFLLRASWGNVTDWPGARVVDDLRTWFPAALAEKVISPTAAGRIRGARLRWWLHQADPDVVVLDDGLGLRVVERLARPPIFVSRLNRDEPTGGHYESSSLDHPDLVIAPVDMELDTEAPVLREHPFRDLGGAAKFAHRETRNGTRRRLGVPDDAVVVAGWGSDGWLDGPDLFIRALWALEAHHGVAAHGLWLGSEVREEVRRLHDEAVRCGLEGRYHLLPYRGQGDTPVDALCADVVFLPTREALLREHLMASIVSGLAVVTFRAADIEDDAVWAVDDLSVEGAAERIVDALEEDRAERSRLALRDVDVALWCGQFLDALDRLRS